MYGIIYCAENTINGKKYVGQTTATLRERVQRHIRRSINCSQMVLHNAIRKYGVEHFVFKEIDSAETKDELDRKEQKWISELNCLAPNGYNVAIGGRSIVQTPEIRAKISSAKTGKKRKPFSQEHIANMRMAQRRRWEQKALLV